MTPFVAKPLRNQLWGANGDAFGGEVVFGLGDGVFAVMEDAGGEGGVGFARGEDVDHMLRGAATATGDDGNRDRFCDGSGDFDVEAVFRAVSIHAGKDDFASAKGFDPLCPFDCLKPSGFASAVDVDIPEFLAVFHDSLGVDVDDDALAAKAEGSFADEVGIFDSGGVDRDFIAAC